MEPNEIFMDTRDEIRHSLQEALDLAPSWGSMFLARHENGWTYTSAIGTRFAMDTRETGWISGTDDERLARYQALGEQLCEIYIEKQEN